MKSMYYLIELEKLVEELRTTTIGNPIWINEKSVFEYEKETVEVACILKLVRATQTLFSMDRLCSDGLFIDMGALFRILSDTVSEIYFLLENYPQSSVTTEKFLKEFFSRKIGQKGNFEDPVISKKIQSSVTRIMHGSENHETLERLKRIHKIFSGYIHGGYAHIMQMYGPKSINASFKISGIPSDIEKERQYQICFEAIKSVYYVYHFVAIKFGKIDLATKSYIILDKL